MFPRCGKRFARRAETTERLCKAGHRYLHKIRTPHRGSEGTKIVNSSDHKDESQIKITVRKKKGTTEDMLGGMVAVPASPAL